MHVSLFIKILLNLHGLNKCFFSDQLTEFYRIVSVSGQVVLHNKGDLSTLNVSIETNIQVCHVLKHTIITGIKPAHQAKHFLRR